jgi:hypothetical protein
LVNVNNSSLCVSNERRPIGIIWDLGKNLYYLFSETKYFIVYFTDSIDVNSFNMGKKDSTWVSAWSITGFSILPTEDLYWIVDQEWQGTSNF